MQRKAARTGGRWFKCSAETEIVQDPLVALQRVSRLERSRALGQLAFIQLRQASRALVVRKEAEAP